MVHIEQLLENLFHTTGWKIEKTKYGLSKESYVAENNDKKVFIKFDVSASALKRLSELEITPHLLYSGELGGRSYVIQEYVHGEHVKKDWFKDHFTDLAKIIKTYQNDEKLRTIFPVKSYEKHLQDEFENLEERLEETTFSLFKTNEFFAAFSELKNQAKQLQEVPLVPVHADPNNKNFLLVGEKIYVIDWDDIIVSDPMRDIGLLLWWYVPKEKWQNFFQIYGTSLTEKVKERIYWWSARNSLSIAIWFDKHRKDEEKAALFLTDFYAALAKKDNPQK